MPAALLLFLLLPGHPLSFVGGLPWGPPALGCAVVLGLTVFAAWPLPGGRWHRWLALATLLLAAAKVGLALTAPRYGLEASYFANDRFHNVPESSTVAPGTPYTRLDQLLDFGSDEFPLFFFNDAERFNLLGPDRLDRGKALVWSARWQGFLNVPDRRSVTIWLTVSGPGELALDGKRLLKVDSEGRETAQARVELTPGPHELALQYARKKERSGFLKVDTDLGGQRAALASPWIAPTAYGAERLAADRAATGVARGVDLGFVAALGAWVVLSVGGAVRRQRALERPLLALIPLGFFLQDTLPRLDRYGKMVFLGGGQDWLTHETLARDIQFNGPLMALGKPLGQGELYYAQPFYPYYLAILHALSGEDYFGVRALQMLGLGVAVVLLYALARRLFGPATGLVTLALLLGVLVPFELAWVARLLISEALYYWLMPAAVLGMVSVEERAGGRGAPPLSPEPPCPPMTGGSGNPPSSGGRGAGRSSGDAWLWVLAGLLLGLACITRGPTLLYLPPAALLLWLSLRRRGLGRGHAARTLAIIGLAAGAVIALVPIRNAVVAGRPALTASSGGVNMEKFHRPSDAVKLAGVDEHPLYNRLGLDQATREVLEYARQDPAGYLGSYLPLAAYTLGLGSALNPLLEEQPVQLQPELLVLNALYLLALVVAPRSRSFEAGLLHAFIAVHFLTMVVFAPYDYENRLVTPMYLFVAVIASAGLAEAAGIIARRSRPRRLPPLPAARPGGPAPIRDAPIPNP
jgi:hypothetical protein